MLKLVLNVEAARHNYVAKLDRGLAYEVPGEGWKTVFFDKASNYLTPLDVFNTREEAQAYVDEGLKAGVNIA